MKKVIAGALAAVFAATAINLTSCGGSGNDGTDGTTAAQTKVTDKATDKADGTSNNAGTTDMIGDVTLTK